VNDIVADGVLVDEEADVFGKQVKERGDLRLDWSLHRGSVMAVVLQIVDVEGVGKGEGEDEGEDEGEGGRERKGKGEAEAEGQVHVMNDEGEANDLHKFEQEQFRVPSSPITSLILPHGKVRTNEMLLPCLGSPIYTINVPPAQHHKSGV
jgi:hypothetical protein